jgi:hypothetical protein
MTFRSAGGVLLPATQRPAASQYASMDRALGSGDLSALTSQTLRLQWVPIDVVGKLVSSISWASNVTALVGGINQLFGLFDNDLGSETGTPYTLLAGSVDDGANAWAATTVKTLALVSAYRVRRAPYLYAGCLVNATTPPSLRGMPSSGSAINALAATLCGNSTAGITALPAVAAAPGVSSNFCYVTLN